MVPDSINFVAGDNSFLVKNSEEAVSAYIISENTNMVPLMLEVSSLLAGMLEKANYFGDMRMKKISLKTKSERRSFGSLRER